eukprot:SAG31_NODE_14696_length_792_cov_1.096681_1_plen_51_part_10
MDALRHLLGKEDALASLALNSVHRHANIIPQWMLLRPGAVGPLVSRSSANL